MVAKIPRQVELGLQELKLDEATSFASKGCTSLSSALFGRGIGGGRSIDLDIAGPDLGDILRVAQNAANEVTRLMPREEGNQLRPRPGLELGAPEVRLIPDQIRLADKTHIVVGTHSGFIRTFMKHA